MGERATPAGEFFRWRPAGVGRRAIPCPRCGGARTNVRLLENLLEALCDTCGRSLALERARVVEKEEGGEALLAQLRAMGALDEADVAGRPAAGTQQLDALIERGALRRDLRLTIDVDLVGRSFAYGAAPLRELVLPEEVERALEDRRARGGVLNEGLRARVLERLGATLRGVGLELGLEALTDPRAIDPSCRRALPLRALEIYRAVPVRKDEGGLVIALWDPLDEEVVTDLESIVEGPVHAILAAPDALTRALADLGVRPAPSAAESGEGDVEVAPLDDAPLDQADPFDGILLEALEEGASEVLVEPRGARASLRYRVRGELRKQREVPSDVAGALADRLEELGKDEAGGAPSDPEGLVRTGRARCEVSGLPVAVDYRVLRTAFGPAVAIELEADEPRAPGGLSHLGLSLDALAAFEAALARRAGIVVIAGPRRGGKTEAYYAALERAVRLGGAVLSLERRPRRVLGGATQLDLAGALAGGDALLHPPPDWLGVDGGADEALALIADVALGGGAVVVTVTASDARTALSRLELAGLPGALVRSHVRAVLARRIVPRTCPRCRIERARPDVEGGLASWVGLGCPACADQGTQGTLPLAELLRPTAGGELAALPGSTPLAARALELVRQGEVPLDAVVDLLP